MNRSFKTTVVWSLLCAMLALCLPLGGLAEAAGKVPDLKDDFYAAVNAEWLAGAQIPPDRMNVGAFDDLEYEIMDLLIADSNKMLTGEIETDNEMLRQYAAFYAMAMDFEKRNSDGAKPLLPYLARIEALDSLASLNADLANWVLDLMPLPFSMTVRTDMGNAQENALYIAAPTLFLPDVSLYDEPYGPMLLETVANIAQQLLSLSGYSEEDVNRITREAIAFDALLVPYAKTAVETSVMKNMYNPQALKDFSGAIANMDFAALAAELVGQMPEQVIVTDPKYFEVFDEIVSDANFGQLKSWMILETAWSMSSCLSETMQATVNSFNDMLMGRAEPESSALLAYQIASSCFGPVVGDYYGRTYFSQEAKDDVTAMVHNFIQVYKKRLENNDWLSAETKAMALRKLDTMAIQVGYPDSIDPLYEKIIITPAEAGGTFLSNAMAFMRLNLADGFAKFSKPVDRDKWALNAHMVNAMNQLLSNTLTFPAAFLQAPFYSLSQSASANYGGIGAVIAHEITHTFDTNGAQFDEYGSIANWWTEEDLAQFEALAQDMTALFDGQPHAGGVVNGALTVSENIADAGGLSCALEVAKSLPDADLAAFFINYATIWRTLQTPELALLLLATDVHAPPKLRVNLQLPLLEEFYETFGIEEGDGMYIAPEARVAIW